MLFAPRAYDLLGRLLTLTYPTGAVATSTYNPQGGIETVTGTVPGGGLSPLVTDAAYNAAGQLTRIAYGNGVVSDYTYSPQTLRLDSLVTRHSSLGTLQDFSYRFDPVGNVERITDAVHTASQTFGYDDLDRLTSASGSYGTFTYAYDAIGNMTLKEGVTMTYGEGSAGPHAVTAVTGPLATDHWSLTYDANGNVLKKIPSRSSMLDQIMRYDADNRLTEVTTAQEVTVTLHFAPGHNVFSLPVIPDDPSIAALFPSFAQDLEWIGHFNAASDDPYVGHYQFYVGQAKFDDFTTLEYGKGYQLYCTNPDGFTVQLRGKVPTSQDALTLLPGWHLLPALAVDGSLTVGQVFSGVAAGRILRYDTASGSLTPVAGSDPAQVGQAYFVEVVSASPWRPPLPRDQTTTLRYDGDGGKVKRITAEGTTTYLGESVEIAPDGTTTTYIFAGSQRIAAVESTGAIRYYHGDHLGSSNVVTDEQGQLVEVAEYTPFGSVVTPNSHLRTSHSFGFTGQRHDDASGLVLFPARAYDPALGRFLQPDPFVQDPSDPQTLNRYAYARNNPLRYVDPSGYGWFSWFLGFIGAVVGAVIGFFACGPECAVSGAIIGFNIGYNAGSWVESHSSGSSPPPNVTFPSLGLPGAAGPTEGPSDLPKAPLPGQPPARAPPTQPPWLRPLVRAAIDLAQELANWDERTASVVEAAEQSSQASMLVEVYYRPLDNDFSKWAGSPGHLFIVYNNGQNLWELLGPNGKIHFNKPTGDQVQAYLEKWNGQLKGPLLVSVDPAKFGQALADQEALEGQSYYRHFFFNNSNFGVRWVINQSITYGIGPAPKGGFGWAPDFFGNPTQ